MSATDIGNDIDSDCEGDGGLTGGEKDRQRGVMHMCFVVQILITNMSSQLFVHADEQRCAVAN